MTGDRDGNPELVAVSIVFPDGTAEPGRLDGLDVVNIRRRFTDALNAIGNIEWMAAGFDVSLNDDTAKELGLRWQLQLYGTAKVWDREAFSKGLRKRYLPSTAIRRPVQIKPNDGSNKAISYGLKTDFVRRVSYWGEVELPGKRRECWKTRKVALRAEEHIELLRWLNKVGLAGRLYLRGVRMTRTAGGVTLVEIKKRE
jgi:hypothetical protein